MDKIRSYYDNLWKSKTSTSLPTSIEALEQRQGFLDRLLRPDRFGRTDVARLHISGYGGKLLDIGCWGGEALVRMNALEIFDEVYAVDLLEDSVSKAIAKGINAVRCDLNLEPLPFADSTFDVVTCLAVLGQVFDPDSVLGEIHRVLQPSGIAVINVPNVASLSNRLRLLRGHAPITSKDPGWDGAQLHYFTRVNVTESLQRHGFAVKNVSPTGGLQAVRRVWPSLLSGTLTFLAVRQ